jgi:hypothetical protein
MHEQERSDRDESVIIHLENISEDGKDQFGKAEPGSDIKSLYDFSSTMHYERTVSIRISTNSMNVIICHPGLPGVQRHFETALLHVPRPNPWDII